MKIIDCQLVSINIDIDMPIEKLYFGMKEFILSGGLED
jgi:hypothetical protein